MRSANLSRKSLKLILLFPALLALALALSCSGGGGSSGGGGGGGGDANGDWTQADYQYLFTHNASYLDGFTIRWPNVPVKVASVGVNDVPQAFIRWEEASGGRLNFDFNQAGNITVGYIPRASYCGQTTIYYNSAGYITEARVLINQDQSRCYGGEADTIAHEAAHACGFFGHDASGIMSPTGGGEITEMNRRFFNLLYSLAPGTNIRTNLQMPIVQDQKSKFDTTGGKTYVLILETGPR